MKQRKRLIAAGFLCIMANVFALIMVTLAWFSATRDIDRGADNLTVKNSQSLHIEYDMYRYNPETKAGELLSPYDPDKYMLDEYDSFIINRNQFINRIVRVDVTFLEEVTARTRLNINIPCVSAYKDTSGNIINNISNIIQFKMFITYYYDADGNVVYGTDDVGDVVNESNNNDLYKSANSYFKALSHGYTFVTNHTKSMTLDIFTNVVPINAKSCTMYIEYNYNDNLVDDFYNSGEAGRDVSALSNGEPVHFGADIQYILFTMGV